MLLDLVGIASEGEKVSTNSEGIIEVGFLFLMLSFRALHEKSCKGRNLSEIIKGPLRVA